MTHIKIFLLHYIIIRLSKETVKIQLFSSKHTHTDTHNTCTRTALALIHWPRGWLLCKTSVLPHFHRKSASFLWCQLCLWAVERKTQSTTLVLSDYQYITHDEKYKMHILQVYNITKLGHLSPSIQQLTNFIETRKLKVGIMMSKCDKH